MYIVRRTGDVSEEINGIVVSERMYSRERNLHDDAYTISSCSSRVEREEVQEMPPGPVSSRETGPFLSSTAVAMKNCMFVWFE